MRWIYITWSMNYPLARHTIPFCHPRKIPNRIKSQNKKGWFKGKQRLGIHNTITDVPIWRVSITCSRKKKNAGYCIFAQKRLRKTKQFIIHNVSVSTACITQSQCILKCYIRLSKSMKSMLKQQKTVNLSLDILIFYIFIPFIIKVKLSTINSKHMKECE